MFEGFFMLMFFLGIVGFCRFIDLVFFFVGIWLFWEVWGVFEVFVVIVLLIVFLGIFVGGIGILFCCLIIEGIEVFDMLVVEDEDEGWEGWFLFDGRVGICVFEVDILVFGEVYWVLKGLELIVMYE